MAIVEGARLHERHGRQGTVFDGIIEIERILQMRIALRLARHDRSGIEERIADVAIKIRDRVERSEVCALAGGGLEVVPAHAEIRASYVGLAERIADVLLLDNSRQRDRAVVDRIAKSAADVTRDIVVEQ